MATVQNMPRGVRVRGSSLQINFTFQGVRCFETLPGVAKINAASIKYAANKLQVIKTEIKEGRFDYARHFPESERAREFSGAGGKAAKQNIGRALDQFLEVSAVSNAATTHKSYKHKAAHIERYFTRGRLLSSITASDIKLFRAHLLRSETPDDGEKPGAGLGPKTANDVFTVLRAIFRAAFDDGGLLVDPMQRVKNLELDETNETADPFTRGELRRVEESERVPDALKNLMLFNCWAGLSVSELMGLAWSDVDLVAGVVKVARGRVNDEYRVPKKKSRERVVELVEPALYWLKQQKARSFMLPEREVEVIQRDNMRRRPARLRFVFINEKTGEPWHQASIGRQFAEMLRAVGIRHRGPNQCRHTFASQCLTAYVPQEWLARQLGHTDTAMIKKHYGRFIRDDVQSMAAQVSQMLVAGGGSEGLKEAENVPKTCQGGAEKLGSVDKSGV